MNIYFIIIYKTFLQYLNYALTKNKFELIIKISTFFKCIFVKPYFCIKLFIFILLRILQKNILYKWKKRTTNFVSCVISELIR